MRLLALSGGGEHPEPPVTIFTALWHAVRDTGPGRWLGLGDEKLGQFWFEAICFALMASVILIACSWLATRNYTRVPRGIQNVMEWAVGLLRGLVRGFMGEKGDKFLPFLGTCFLFIYIMNMLGIIPAFRSPTMTLSTTAAMGVTAFLVVQFYCIREVGLWKFCRHFAGDILWLAPLMVVVEILGELARPVTLSLRLYGNIFGEDQVIEQLMIMGGWIPLQIPMLIFALLTSFLQAFIFTSLCSIYIGQKVAHEGEHHEEGHAEESHAH